MRFRPGVSPPFIYFGGIRRYPGEDEIIQNDVYFVMPAREDLQARPESVAGPEPYRDEDSWREAVPKHFRSRSAFAWPDPDPQLPNVLLIGYSISISYTAQVRRRLDGAANVFRAPANCRSTRQTLREIERRLGRRQWDVIHLNGGIRDVTLVGENGRADTAGIPQVPLKSYRRNLQRLIRRLKATGARLVWGRLHRSRRRWGFRAIPTSVPTKKTRLRS
jgi:hypothetical protein